MNTVSDANMQERFFTWLSERVSPAQLSELYMAYNDIDKYFVGKKVLKAHLFQTTDLAILSQIRNTIEGDRYFRVLYKRSLRIISAAMRYYMDFLKESAIVPQEKPAAEVRKSAVEPDSSEEKNKPAKPAEETRKPNITAAPPKDEIQTVDLADERSYSFTTPISFSYFGEETAVSSWREVYTKCIAILLDDYPSTILSLRGSPIVGRGRVDLCAPKFSALMTAPKKVSDEVYAETNYSASDLMLRLRALLDRCNVDYENLQITFRRNTAPGSGKGKRDVPGHHSDPGKILTPPRLRTITESIYEVLRKTGRPMTVSEIYDAIIQDDLYSFGAKDPKSVVFAKAALACDHAEERIREGRDALIRTEVNGRRAFQVLSAKEAAVYLKELQWKHIRANAAPWRRYENVLMQAFPKGFQKESILDMMKLRKRWLDIYGEELADSDETVCLQLADHCVDTGKRWYLAELLLSDKDRETVLRYIDSVFESGRREIYYSSIYAALEHQLDSMVLTADLLKSYLRATCQNRYDLREDYLTSDENVQVDISAEIRDVMVAHGRPIHKEELKEALYHLPSKEIESKLHTNSEFIMDSQNKYFHESMADLTELELDQIAGMIQEELDDQGYMIGNQIQMKLAQYHSETAERLSFLTPLGVRGAVGYKLRDRFAFSGPVITPKGSAMNLSDVFSMFCKRHAPFTLDDLTAFAEECDTTIYLDTVHLSCIRISESEFRPNGDVRWDIPHADVAISLFCPGKYISLKSIQYFDAFPFVGYPWNSYLLEQYVATISKDFMLMHSSYAKNDTSGAIVRRDSEFASFHEVLADILATAPVNLEKDACLEYLVKEGFINKKKISNIHEIILRARMQRSQRG